MVVVMGAVDLLSLMVMLEVAEQLVLVVSVIPGPVLAVHLLILHDLLWGLFLEMVEIQTTEVVVAVVVMEAEAVVVGDQLLEMAEAVVIMDPQPQMAETVTQAEPLQIRGMPTI
jgi:hypothetical protein